MVSWDPAASATERTFSSPPSSMASAYWCPIGFELSPFIMRRPSPSPGPFHDLGINRFGDGKQACWQFWRYSGGETSNLTDELGEFCAVEPPSLPKIEKAIREADISR